MYVNLPVLKAANCLWLSFIFCFPFDLTAVVFVWTDAFLSSSVSGLKVAVMVVYGEVEACRDRRVVAAARNLAGDPGCRLEMESGLLDHHA